MDWKGKLDKHERGLGDQRGGHLCSLTNIGESVELGRATLQRARHSGRLVWPDVMDGLRTGAAAKRPVLSCCQGPLRKRWQWTCHGDYSHWPSVCTLGKSHGQREAVTQTGV